MLPDNQVLGIADVRPLYTKGQPNSKITWTGWTTSGDRLCSILTPHKPLDPFLALDTRAELSHFPPISSLAMIINAYSKLQSFLRTHRPSVSPRIQRYSQLISELVSEIFFVPDQSDPSHRPQPLTGSRRRTQASFYSR